jgi:hypothetical protein
MLRKGHAHARNVTTTGRTISYLIGDVVHYLDARSRLVFAWGENFILRPGG